MVQRLLRSSNARSLAYRSSRQSSALGEFRDGANSIQASDSTGNAMEISVPEIGADGPKEPGIPGEFAEHEETALRVVHRGVAGGIDKRRHHQIPEDLVELKAFLQALGPAETHKSAASDLLDILLHEANRAIVSELALSNLLGHSGDRGGLFDLPGGEPVLVLLACQNWFDLPQWQVVRAITCVSCTPEAARQLAMLADRDGMIPSLSFWRAHDCSCLLSASGQFETLDVRRSVQAAWSRDLFCVVPGGRRR